MRVVAGTLGGRKFAGPDGYDTRPTTDRVREAIFNSLNSLDVLVGATVADLFAGSGGLGIEALSRGAEHCTFVENNRSTLRVLRSNLASLGLDGRSTVIAANALAVGATLDVDLVLADPPYDFEGWPELLAQVRAPIVVAEAATAIDPSVGWQQIRAKRYGRTWVSFLRAEQRVDSAAR